MHTPLPLSLFLFSWRKLTSLIQLTPPCLFLVGCSFSLGMREIHLSDKKSEPCTRSGLSRICYWTPRNYIVRWEEEADPLRFVSLLFTLFLPSVSVDGRTSPKYCLSVSAVADRFDGYDGEALAFLPSFCGVIQYRITNSFVKWCPPS